MEFIMFAVLIALGMLLLVFKLGTRKVLGYDLFFDVIITGIMMASLAGTFAGMTVALLAGLMVSLALLGLKKLIGKEQLKYKRHADGSRKWQWEYTAGYFERNDK